MKNPPKPGPLLSCLLWLMLALSAPAALAAEAELDKQTAVRVDLIHQRTHFNDWAWGYAGVPYTYSDGSTVSQRQQQNVNFVGVTYTIFTNCVNPIRKQCPGGVVSRHQRLPQRHLNGLQGAVFNSAASG